jgi:predicted Fe-Mo cluster-binding NifX family protein
MLMGDLDWPERLERLAAAGVSVVLCAGFGRRFVPSAEVRGIQVVNCLSGRAEDLIVAFINGTLEEYRFPRRTDPGVCGRVGHRRVFPKQDKEEGRR